MKRMHIHVGVGSIDAGVKFYSALFGQPPSKTKPDYAKWMLDDPRINFAISTRIDARGVDHLGLQVDDLGELEELRENLRSANLPTFDDGEIACCYARSEKSWLIDPAGVAWEAFKSMDDVKYYSGDSAADPAACDVDSPQSRPSQRSDMDGQAAGCCD